MMQRQPPAFLHVIALMEGSSLLLLLCVGLPLKYGFGVAAFNQWVGPVHGGLFLLYMAALLVVLLRSQMPKRWGPVAALCAFIPGGTFWLMHRLRRA